MQGLNSTEVLYFLTQMTLLLVAARFFGELLKWLKQPAIVGELLAGILLGPSFLEAWYPNIFHDIFIAHPNSTIAMNGVFNIAVVMLLFISGMEIELPLIWKNGRSALSISAAGMLIPFALGTTAGWYFFQYFHGGSEEYRLVFSLFMGTALSITALPVIAKILLDLNLLNSKIGSLIITCAMLDDFIGWILFSIVLSLMPKVAGSNTGFVFWQTAIYTVLFAVLILTVFKFVLDKILYYLSKRFMGPGGAMTIAMTLCFIGAVITEYIGIHAVFGAFLMGIAFGESRYFSERSKDIIHQFVSNIFVPLFFVSIGLKVDFIHNFDLGIVMLILGISFVAKILGGFLGGKIGGLNNYEALTIGFGINARGAMEIILGLLALQAGLINDKVFVGLTIMAIFTSITAGSFIKYFVGREARKKLD